jgi:hypothetical protein
MSKFQRIARAAALVPAALAVATLVLGLSFAAAPAVAQSLPTPTLVSKGTEAYSISSGRFIRYRLDVANKDKFPADQFAAAPTLPPCGANANASRTWVDIFDADTGARLYGFCALKTPADLGGIWFAVKEDAKPPARVYIELTDRQSKWKLRSNSIAVPAAAPAPAASTPSAPKAAARVTMPPLPGSFAEAMLTGATPQRENLVGRWTDDGDCSKPVTLNADGTFVTPGGGSGKWDIQFGKLVLTGNSRIEMRALLTGDRLILADENGGLAQSVRCPA